MMEVGAPVPTRKGDPKEFKVIEKPVAVRPVEKKQEPSSLEMADKYLKEGKKYEARNMLSDIFINKKLPQKQREVKALLDTLNKDLIFSSAPSPMPRYTPSRRVIVSQKSQNSSIPASN